MERVYELKKAYKIQMPEPIRHPEDDKVAKKLHSVGEETE